MKNIVAFAASSSKQSINKQLVQYVCSLLQQNHFEVLDLNDYPLPVFNVDIEKQGYPANALRFKDKLYQASGIIISLAEHNGSYTAVFKNLFDWLSRIELEMWQHKPMLLLSTSTGARGGKGVMEAALSRFPRHGLNLAASLSIPSFNENFTDGRIVHAQYNTQLLEAVYKLEGMIAVV